MQISGTEDGLHLTSAQDMLLHCQECRRRIKHCTGLLGAYDAQKWKKKKSQEGALHGNRGTLCSLAETLTTGPCETNCSVAQSTEGYYC